jgi:hypothetical protein
MTRQELAPLAKRLLACLAGGIVLALMWGQQEGSSEDYGLAFRQSVLNVRIVWFLALGVIAFLLITFWPRIQPYAVRPGVRPLFAGFVIVILAQGLLHWDDQVGDAKFGTVADAVAATPAISWVAAAFFGWLAWTQWIVLLVLSGAVVATRSRPLAWITAALAVVAAVDSWVAHELVVDFAHQDDHSLGAGVAALGYLVVVVGVLTAAASQESTARTREFFERVAAWRPGLPVTVLGLLVGLLGFGIATWFSPDNLNATLADTASTFATTGLAGIAKAYLGWLGWVLLVLTVIASGAGAYLRNQLLGWLGLAVGAVGVVLTLVTLYDMSALAAQQAFDSATGPWCRRTRCPTRPPAGPGCTAGRCSRPSSSWWRSRCSTRRWRPASGSRCWSPRSASTCCSPSASTSSSAGRVCSTSGTSPSTRSVPT